MDTTEEFWKNGSWESLIAVLSHQGSNDQIKSTNLFLRQLQKASLLQLRTAIDTARHGMRENVKRSGLPYFNA